jgi:uncharacterized membrane protein
VAVKQARVQYPREVGEYDRAIGFIDATFALAMTLLVTTLDVDDVPQAFQSLSTLDDAIGAQFFAFLISFAVVASYWLVNHRMVAGFVGIDTPTIVAHLFLLAAIVLLPFTTKSVGDPGAYDLPLPTVMMAVSIAAVSALSTMVWVVGSRRGLLDHTPTPAEWREMVINGLVPAAVFLASVPVAYLASPTAARASWLLLIVLNPGVSRMTARARRREA